MTKNFLTTQEVIAIAKKSGANIVSEKSQESGICSAKILAIKNGSCNIKVSYMKLGERIIDIQSTCCCNNYGLYNPLACSCFLKKFNINFENK